MSLCKICGADIIPPYQLCGDCEYEETYQRLGKMEAERDALRTRIAELELLNEAYRERLSPAISCPIDEFLGPVKPCPFCGSEGINLYEDQVECGNCRATAEPGPWQFRDTRKLEAAEARIRELEWQIWRQLKEGEMTQNGDQYLDPDEDAEWKLITDAQRKHPASDPRFPAHVKYRRKIVDEYRARVAELETTAARLREAYRLMRSAAAGYSQHCESFTTKYDKEFERAEDIARAALEVKP